MAEAAIGPGHPLVTSGAVTLTRKGGEKEETEETEEKKEEKSSASPRRSA